ncbi:MAG: hypothetical protein KIT33_06560 [Candidatus Kapabacteria bacterium]|nr:hypothetical protein [Ignavibacteriota bacterium]MCW5884616.1 hypothetical protein [Candidatus Kapabacteria bacterium]
MAEPKKVKIDDGEGGIEYYGFDDSDLFPGATEKADKPINLSSESANENDNQESNPDNTSKAEPELIEPLISENELAEIIKSDPNISLKKGGQQKKESNLIKQEEIKKKQVLSAADFQREIEKTVQKKSINWSEISGDYEDNDFLEDEFLDFIEFPLISGEEQKISGKTLITSDLINSSSRRIEIVDEPDADEHLHTSIEISRTDSGDIESIAVYCKCGEVTQIRFNYQEDSGKDSIEYIKTQTGIEPLHVDKIKINTPKK